MALYKIVAGRHMHRAYDPKTKQAVGDPTIYEKGDIVDIDDHIAKAFPDKFQHVMTEREAKAIQVARAADKQDLDAKKPVVVHGGTDGSVTYDPSTGELA